MKKQAGFIDIPSWFFWLAPIGALLLCVELVRLVWWIYEHVEIALK
jgi:hypothetical protein